jgi:SAM-dependent methyltransferase
MTNDGVNPWLEISAADYEEHMGPNGVGQLSVLSEVFGQEYGRLMPGRLAVLGCATGNGLERVDPGITHRTVGVDLNQQYLEIARARLTRLGKRLELICAPLETCEFESESFDLIFAGLVFEYVEPEPLIRRATSWLAPGGVFCVVLQLPSRTCPAVTPTGCQSLKKLERIMNLVPPGDLKQMFRQCGLTSGDSQEIPLRFGKQFHVQAFAKPRLFCPGSDNSWEAA